MVRFDTLSAVKCAKCREIFRCAPNDAPECTTTIHCGGYYVLWLERTIPDYAITQRVPTNGGKQMRIGVFGGSFDPVHLGHLVLAELSREQCRLDEVRLVPAAIPSHKQFKDRAPDQRRLEMLKLAIGGHSSIQPWDVELQRGGVSYTADTLRTLRDEQPNAELFLLMGADSLFDLPNWREPNEICQLACLVVVNRLGSEPVDFDVLSNVTTRDRIDQFQKNLVDMPLLEISSTDLRRRVAAGKSIRYQTPRAVEQYIKTAELYV